MPKRRGWSCHVLLALEELDGSSHLHPAMLGHCTYSEPGEGLGNGEGFPSALEKPGINWSFLTSASEGSHPQQQQDGCSPAGPPSPPTSTAQGGDNSAALGVKHRKRGSSSSEIKVKG